jgi:hypothetical protein
MANPSSLSQKAKQCLAKATDIPGAPLWNLGKGAVFGSDEGFTQVQKAVDYLTCKAKARLPFSADERTFLKELYEAFWWGGKAKGLWEAAELASHYVNGNGAALRVSADLYKTSTIVRDASAGMKEYIRSLRSTKPAKPLPPMLGSDDAGFRQSQQFKSLATASGRSQQSQGILLPDGALQAEQANQRLQKADNRFYLKAFLSPLEKEKLHTRWRVDSVYDFEPFEKKDYISRVPIGDWTLILPDGLSQYMTVLGVAKAFDYYAEWDETWSL